MMRAGAGMADFAAVQMDHFVKKHMNDLKNLINKTKHQSSARVSVENKLETLVSASRKLSELEKRPAQDERRQIYQSPWSNNSSVMQGNDIRRTSAVPTNVARCLTFGEDPCQPAPRTAATEQDEDEIRPAVQEQRNDAVSRLLSFVRSSISTSEGKN